MPDHIPRMLTSVYLELIAKSVATTGRYVDRLYMRGILDDDDLVIIGEGLAISRRG